MVVMIALMVEEVVVLLLLLLVLAVQVVLVVLVRVPVVRSRSELQRTYANAEHVRDYTWDAHITMLAT